MRQEDPGSEGPKAPSAAGARLQSRMAPVVALLTDFGLRETLTWAR